MDCGYDVRVSTSLDYGEGEQVGLRAHYVYEPPASPLPGVLLVQRHSARASSPVGAVIGIPVLFLRTDVPVRAYNQYLGLSRRVANDITDKCEREKYDVEL